MEDPTPLQDLFDTQMEDPFSEDIVEPVFKRSDVADFTIPPVIEEMIPDGALIHKHLPKQADMDRILAQINISGNISEKCTCLAVLCINSLTKLISNKI